MQKQNAASDCHGFEKIERTIRKRAVLAKTIGVMRKVRYGLWERVPVSFGWKGGEGERGKGNEPFQRRLCYPQYEQSDNDEEVPAHCGDAVELQEERRSRRTMEDREGREKGQRTIVK